jgi:hypothetical protein
MRMKTFLPLFLTLSSVLFGCATYPTAGEERRRLPVQLQDIVPEDGINAAEADVFAQSYFRRFGPMCGAASKVADVGEFWVSSTLVGFAAAPTREPIRIEKRTGQVSWSDGPTVANPKTIWSAPRGSKWVH